MHWVIIANTNTCRIYQFDKKNAALSLLKELTHPKLRLKPSEALTSDKPGRYQTINSARGAYSPPKDAKAVAIENFAKEIANALDHGRTTNAFTHIILIAEPHMQGVLLKELNQHVKAFITNHIQKDILHLQERELLNFLREHAKYPD